MYTVFAVGQHFIVLWWGKSSCLSGRKSKIHWTAHLFVTFNSRNNWSSVVLSLLSMRKKHDLCSTRDVLPQHKLVHADVLQTALSFLSLKSPWRRMSQKLLKSSYFFIQSICGAFLFSLAWTFIFSSAAVALRLRPISANGSCSRPPSSSAS